MCYINSKNNNVNHSVGRSWKTHQNQPGNQKTSENRGWKNWYPILQKIKPVPVFWYPKKKLKKTVPIFWYQKKKLKKAVPLFFRLFFWTVSRGDHQAWKHMIFRFIFWLTSRFRRKSEPCFSPIIRWHYGMISGRVSVPRKIQFAFFQVHDFQGEKIWNILNIYGTNKIKNYLLEPVAGS